MNDAGRIGFLVKGTYDNTATYDFLDVVYYNNATYVAKKLTVGNKPQSSNEFWQVLMDKNEDSVTAEHVIYDNENSGLQATNTQEAIDEVNSAAKTYTDTKISDLINGAPETLNTLKEVAEAIAENEDVVEGLNAAIGSKANISDLTAHTGNKSNPHGVTKSQVGLGNVPNVATNDQTPTYTASSALTALSSGEKLSVAFGKIAKAVSNLISHIANTSNPHGVTAEQIGVAPTTTTDFYTSKAVSWGNNNSNPSKITSFTATKTGMHYINGEIHFSANATGERTIELIHSSSTLSYGTIHYSTQLGNASQLTYLPALPKKG